MFAWSAAEWTWVFVARGDANSAPAPVERIEARAAARTIAARGLFGTSGVDARSPAQSTLNLKLLGVFAIHGPETPVAIIEVPGSGQRAVALGADVMPGVKLDAVHPAYVLLRSAGALERLELPKPGGSDHGAPASKRGAR